MKNILYHFKDKLSNMSTNLKIKKITLNLKYKIYRTFTLYSISETIKKLKKALGVSLRTLLPLVTRVKDLANQKLIAQREAKSLYELTNNIKERLKLINKAMEPSKSKYIQVLKFRRVTIVVIAANRLKRGMKELSYGERVKKSSMGIMPVSKFEEDIINKLIAKIPKNWNIEGEQKLIIESLRELYNASLQGRFDHTSNGKTMIAFLHEGLKEIKNKCRNINIPENIIKILYRDLFFQEDIKNIEDLVSQVKLLPQLKVQVNIYKDQKENIERELQATQKEHEKAFNKVITELNEVKDTSISSSEYQKILQSLESKQKEVIAITNNYVLVYK